MFKGSGKDRLMIAKVEIPINNVLIARKIDLNPLRYAIAIRKTKPTPIISFRKPLKAAEAKESKIRAPQTGWKQALMGDLKALIHRDKFPPNFPRNPILVA